MRTVVRMWVSVAVATILSSMALLPLTTDRGYLVPAAVMMVLLAAVAVAGERLAVNRALVNLVQVVLAAVMFVALAIAPGPSQVSWYGRLVPLVRSGYDHIRTTAAPMTEDPGTRLILIMLVVLLGLTAGLLADTLERPSWTLAPLLTMYLIPAVALRTDVNALSFVVVVVGYLVILFADGLSTDAQWTRNLASDTAEQQPGTGGVWRIAAVVATPAVIGAVILGMLLPTFAPTFMSSFRPNGSGPIEMTDPQLDLRRNLQQPDNRTVLTYTTSRPDGVYLRQATLPVITPDGWVQSQVSLKQGAIGPVPGVSGVPVAGPRTTQVEIGELRSMYLPVPYAPRAQSAGGDWSYDPASLMIIATGTNRSRATENLKYSVESWDITPDGTALSNATVGTPEGAPNTVEVPSDVPASIISLTNQITTGIESPALKAAAIQAYLRSQQFTYSIQGASGSTNYAAIETFLTKTKTGYCVQFAGSMALMARVAGIPSRVAVGFLPGTKSGERYIVTAHDMHAWPELYFEGQGWVRFEPTPSVAVPPPWTIVSANQPTTQPTSEPEPSIQPSAEPSAAPQSEEPTPIDTDQNSAASAVWRGLGWAALAIAVVLVALTPLAVRLLRRRRRLAVTGDPHEIVASGWLEVRDTWLDLGRQWPTGTPRQISAVVSQRLPEESSREHLTSLVSAVEKSRYAPDLSDATDALGDATAVTTGLLNDVTWDGRLLARFAPRSLGHALRDWFDRTNDAIAERFRGLVERRSAGTADVSDQPEEEDTESFKRPLAGGLGRSS